MQVAFIPVLEVLILIHLDRVAVIDKHPGVKLAVEVSLVINVSLPNAGCLGYYWNFQLEPVKELSCRYGIGGQSVLVVQCNYFILDFSKAHVVFLLLDAEEIDCVPVQDWQDLYGFVVSDVGQSLVVLVVLQLAHPPDERPLHFKELGLEVLVQEGVDVLEVKSSSLLRIIVNEPINVNSVKHL